MAIKTTHVDVHDLDRALKFVHSKICAKKMESFHLRCWQTCSGCVGNVGKMSHSMWLQTQTSGNLGKSVEYVSMCYGASAKRLFNETQSAFEICTQLSGIGRILHKFDPSFLSTCAQFVRLVALTHETLEVTVFAGCENELPRCNLSRVCTKLPR